MNNVLELKGKRFGQSSKTGGGGGVTMNSRKVVTTEHLSRLKSQLTQIKGFWDKESKPFEGILVSVYYNKIVAKSNRIGGLFKGKNSNKAIVGAKFNENKSKHIITYFLDTRDLNVSIDLLSDVAEILSQKFSNHIDKNSLDDKKIVNSKLFYNLSIRMSVFKQVIADASYIDSFEVQLPTIELKQSIITLYDVKEDTRLIFRKLGIDLLSTRI